MGHTKTQGIYENFFSSIVGRGVIYGSNKIVCVCGGGDDGESDEYFQ